MLWLLNYKVHMGGSEVFLREIVGNVFGLLSALGGMRRKIWAWPIGIVGNVILFTCFLSGVFDNPQNKDMYGQAGRQVFFLIVSVYGWYRWYSNRNRSSDNVAVRPRWARGRERLAMLLGGAICFVAFYFVLKSLGSWGPVADAWILTGSILATYGMARGYVEFWLIWVAVDAVGVPLLWKAKFYPSAAMYIFYGAFCLWGVFAWWRLERSDRRSQSRSEPEPSPVGLPSR